MDETVLTWTVPNWITVVLMCFLGFMFLAFAGKLAGKVIGAGKSDA